MRWNLSPRRLLAGYVVGIFPMADDDGNVHWLAPDPRAIIDLDAFKVSRSLRTLIRRDLFEIRINSTFADVISACADRPDGTWISPQIRDAYTELHRLGFAHSVEAWKNGALAGGLYGVAIGGAFFGESMFHRVTGASKVAMVHLVERMRQRGMTLLDVQFMTKHLASFGAVEIARRDYQRRLCEAVRRPCTFVEDAGSLTVGENLPEHLEP
jgi:leucyl/phenylalanyl-tRNA--protein transferase